VRFKDVGILFPAEVIVKGMLLQGNLKMDGKARKKFLEIVFNLC